MNDKKLYTTVQSFEQCIRSLRDRLMELRRKAETLRNEVIQLEFERARLTYECESIRRRADSWKRTQEGAQRMACTLSEQMSSALKVLCGTEVCSDGRSIADHMRDAHRKLGLLPEEPKKESIPESQDDESSEFYF